MGSSQSVADYIVDQIKDAGVVSYRKMFGEYAIYCNGKMPALICDDQLFIKPTEIGRNFIGEVEEAPPYPGAKNWFLISGDSWDDSEWLTELVRITSENIPMPKPKKKKTRKNV